MIETKILNSFVGNKFLVNGGTGLIGRTVDWYKKTFHNKTPEDLI